MQLESFDRTPAQCRAIIAWRLGRHAARALRRLETPQPPYPKLDVLPEDTARVLAAYDRHCAYCARDLADGVACDFLVPAARGGTAHPENLVAACDACKTARRGRHLDAFLASRMDLDARAVYARIARATARLRADATCDRSAA